MRLAPVVFIVGPSGVGKNAVCGWIKSQYNFEWVDIDQRIGSRIHFEALGLQPEWKRLKRLDPQPLASALRRKASEANAIGVLMSLPSDKIILPEMAKAAETVGMYTLVLWGTVAACKAAQEGRDGYVKDNYYQKNQKALAIYGGQEFEDNRVEVFGADGKHLSPPEVMALIRTQLVRCYESPSLRDWAAIF